MSSRLEVEIGNASPRCGRIAGVRDGVQPRSPAPRRPRRPCAAGSFGGSPLVVDREEVILCRRRVGKARCLKLPRPTL